MAAIFFIGLTLLLAGYGGIFGGALDFMPKLQFLPAVLALNFGFIALVVVLTLVFGRIYCSVICPLGVFQDVVNWLGSKIKYGKKKRRFHYRKEKKWLRYGVFGLFVLALLLGFQVFVLLIAPYSLYGRFVNSLFHNYGLAISLVAIGTVVLIAVLAFLYGRSWCNTICPVGTALSFLSRFSLFRPVIDTSKCKSCKKCEHQCKANCIDIKHHKIDYSRCVTCFDCVDSCKFGALHYTFAYGKKQEPEPQKHSEKSDGNGTDLSRRAFLLSSALVGLSLAEAAADEKSRKLCKEALREGKPERKPKEEPKRERSITPPGSIDRQHFYDHCTACHLCVVSCPEKIIRPSLSLDHFMQVELTYAQKFCNPECNRCAEVCPAGAILPYLLEDKKNQHFGLAVVDDQTCIGCSRCEKVCPYGAISMIKRDPDNPRSRRLPVVDAKVCIGCGQCEHYCVVRPISAIHVEGLDRKS